ncbi:helix-turn-helix domain-containing protein [Pseudoflavonifractor phocaeensis]
MELAARQLEISRRTLYRKLSDKIDTSAEFVTS